MEATGGVVDYESADDDSTAEGQEYSAISVARTPPQLRRLLKKIRVPLKPENYMLIVYEAMRIVNEYARSSPPWLKRELTVSLLNEVDALDSWDMYFPRHVADFQHLIDSGVLDQLESSRCGCCCGWC